MLNNNNDLFDGLSMDFGFADSAFVNTSNPTNSGLDNLPALSEQIHGEESLVDVENMDNKRARINRTKHKRVHSDPNVLARFANSDTIATTSSSSNNSLRLNSYPSVSVVEENEIPDALSISISSQHPQHGAQHGAQHGGQHGGHGGHANLKETSTNFPPRPPRNHFLDGMGDFLNMFSMPELSKIGDNSDIVYRNQKIKQEVDEIKTKRKRMHQRHHSNPVDLLHNLDQIRQIAQEAQGSRRGIHPSVSASSIPEHENGMTESMFGEEDMLDMDMDISDFNSLTEEQKNLRRQYKCGRCGKPKVGHICEAPEQRNNFTQVDLGLTTGTKPPELPYKVLQVKTIWVTQHEDYM